MKPFKRWCRRIRRYHRTTDWYDALDSFYLAHDASGWEMIHTLKEMAKDYWVKEICEWCKHKGREERFDWHYMCCENNECDLCGERMECYNCDGRKYCDEHSKYPVYHGNVRKCCCKSERRVSDDEFNRLLHQYLPLLKSYGWDFRWTEEKLDIVAPPDIDGCWLDEAEEYELEWRNE
jgi:hypothetical protein